LSRRESHDLIGFLPLFPQLREEEEMKIDLDEKSRPEIVAFGLIPPI